MQPLDVEPEPLGSHASAFQSVDQSSSLQKDTGQTISGCS